MKALNQCISLFSSFFYQKSAMLRMHEASSANCE